jgi:hypothetical protein
MCRRRERRILGLRMQWFQDERNVPTSNYSLNLFTELKNLRKKEMIVKEH